MTDRTPLPLWKNILFTAIVVGILFGLPETVLRIMDYRQPVYQAAAPTGEIPGSPYLLWELSPGRRNSYGAVASINSLGLRGPEIAIPGPPGVRRFITLGDSSVYGFGVRDDEVFGQVAARTLGPPAEVVNGAIEGYSTYQTLNLLKMRALATRPDLFVVCNLWSDNNFDNFVDKEMLELYGEYGRGWRFRLEQLLGRSRLFQAIDWQLAGKARARRVRTVGWMRSARAKQGYGHARRVSINDYARNLEALAQLALERRAQLLFIVLANQEDLRNDPSFVWPWSVYRTVMRDTAKRHGAPVIEVPDLFRASGLPTKALFLDAMHPTATGHRLIGEALAGRLRNAGWLEGASIMSGGTGGPVPQYQDPFEHDGRARRVDETGPDLGTVLIR